MPTILKAKYDYVMREDILLSLEYNDLSDRYATVLLDMDKPLAAIFSKLEHTESPHMEHVWDCVEHCAKDTLEAQQMTGLPIYPHSAAYAREHDELPVYRASYQANVDCSIGKLAGVDTPESGSKEFQFLPAQAAAGTQRHIAAVGSPFNELSEFI